MLHQTSEVRAGEIDSSFQYVLLTALADAEAAAEEPRKEQLARVQRAVLAGQPFEIQEPFQIS